MRPSYASGFATYPADSKYPELWRRLVGAWCPFLGNTGPDLLRDMSGHHNPGTLVGPTWAASKYGPALLFDGTNDCVDIGNVSGAPTGANPRTITFWFAADSWDTGIGDTILMYAPSVTSGHRVQIHAEDNGVAIGYAGHRTIAEKGNLISGVWYHVAFVIEAGAANTNDPIIYINGGEKSLPTEAGSQQTLNTDPVDLHFGASQIATSFYNGKLSSVSIYNHALTANEIGLLYREPYAMFEYADIPYARVAVVAAAHAGRLVLSRRLKSKVGGGLV